MTRETTALLAAAAASLCFSSASVLFARYTRLLSSVWMNTVKALVCWTALAVTVLLFGLWSVPAPASITGLAISGALGLGIGDLFLLSAFARLGASRTLMLFGFQPVLVGVGAALLFHQPVEPARAMGILFFILCLFLLSFERYKKDGHWELTGLLFALLGVVLDNVGVLMTRWSFEQSPELNPFTANLFRTSGALAVFALYSLFRPLGLREGFTRLPRTDRGLVVLASFCGSFLSLGFYLHAVKTGHLASISGLTLSGPLFAALIECLIQKKWPSPYLIAGLSCLFAGMGLVFFGPS